jgi:hypothetical protein
MGFYCPINIPATVSIYFKLKSKWPDFSIRPDCPLYKINQSQAKEQLEISVNPTPKPFENPAIL